MYQGLQLLLDNEVVMVNMYDYVYSYPGSFEEESFVNLNAP